jgi:hypothetical protein
METIRVGETYYCCETWRDWRLIEAKRVERLIGTCERVGEAIARMRALCGLEESDGE